MRSGIVYSYGMKKDLYAEKNPEIASASQAFFQALVEGNSVEDSANIAGLDQRHAERDNLPVVLTPRLRVLARGYIKGKIDVEGSPIAYRVLKRLLLKESTSDSNKIEIAKFFIGHSIAAPKAESENADKAKDLNEMNDKELAEFIAQGDVELKARGKLIDVTPNQAIDDLI